MNQGVLDNAEADFYKDDVFEQFGSPGDGIEGNNDKIHHQSGLSAVDGDPVGALSDERLAKMSIKGLNKYIRSLSQDQTAAIRKRRRILKNRKYALKCRRKSAEKRVGIEEENAVLEAELFQAKQELRRVAEERDRYKTKYQQLSDTFSALRSAALAGENLLGWLVEIG